MKKILSLMLACMCLCTNLVMASNEPSQSTNVTLDMPASYTWKAPASLELNEDSPVIGTVEVTENVIPEGSKLVISLAAENNFTVTSDEGATRTYSITKDSSTVNAGDEIMSVPAGTNEMSQVLNFAVESISGGKKAGTFKGTANFTAKVKVLQKGDIVTLSQLGLGSVDVLNDGIEDTFHILSVDGSEVKLLAMDSYSSVNYNSTDINAYADSTLDTEMTNYYNALPQTVKEKIIPQNIKQGTYSRSTTSTGSDVLHITPISGSEYYYANTATSNVGSRNVFALDVQDIIDYLGNDITGTQLNEMFFGSSDVVSRGAWLLSASADYSDRAFLVYGNGGYMDISKVSSSKAGIGEYEVCPAFVINLG